MKWTKIEKEDVTECELNDAEESIINDGFNQIARLVILPETTKFSKGYVAYLKISDNIIIKLDDHIYSRKRFVKDFIESNLYRIMLMIHEINPIQKLIRDLNKFE
jgi:hypothetical protein